MKGRGIFFLIFCFISVSLFTQNPGNEKKHSRSVLSQAPPGLSFIYESDRDVKTKGRHFQMPRSFYTSKDYRKKDYETSVQAKEAQITGLSCVQIGPTGGDVVAAEVYNDNLYILTKGYPSKLMRLENDEWKKVLSINERCYGLHINNNGDMCIPGKSKLHVLRSGEASPISTSYPEGFAITTSAIEEYAPYRIDSSRADPNDVWVAGEKDNLASVARFDISSGTVSVVSVRAGFASSIQGGNRQVAVTVTKDQINPSKVTLGGINFYADGTTTPFFFSSSNSGTSWTGRPLPSGTGSVFGARASPVYEDEQLVLTDIGILDTFNSGDSWYPIGLYATSCWQDPFDPDHILSAGIGTVTETKDFFLTVGYNTSQFANWGNCITYYKGQYVVGTPLYPCKADTLTDGVLMPENSKKMYCQWTWREGSLCSQDPGQLVIGEGHAYVDSEGNIIPGTGEITCITYTDQAASWDVSTVPKPDPDFVLRDVELTADGESSFFLDTGGAKIWEAKWDDSLQLFRTPDLYGFHLDYEREHFDIELTYGVTVETGPDMDSAGLLSGQYAFVGSNIEPGSKTMIYEEVTDRPGSATLIGRNGEKISTVVEFKDKDKWGLFIKEGEGDFQQQGIDVLKEIVDHLQPIVVQTIQSKRQATTYTDMIGTPEGPYGFDGTDWVKLADFHVSDLEESTSYSKIVFAGGQDGLYFTDDFGVTWQEIELQPADESEVQLSDEDDSFEPWISSVHLDDERKALFIGTWGSSTLRLDVASLFKKILTISAGTGGTTDPAAGNHEYNIGQEASVKAIPNSGYTFSKWTGNVPSGKETTNPVAIIMDAVKSITANFTQTSSGGGGGDTGGEGGGGCFIATACYGTPMAEEVKVLSAFRDKYLITNPVGQAFVKLYHKHSPKVADFIRDKEQLKVIVRKSLKPFIFVISNIVE